MKQFIFKIEITSNSYDYNIGDLILIVVNSNNWYNAERKLMITHTGSEYPKFKIKEKVNEDWLFSYIK